MKRFGIFVLLLLAIPQAAHAAYPIDAIEKLAAEKNLHRLGLPTGGVDGKWDGQTQRAICAWRELTGRVVSRDLLTYEETLELAVTTSLTATPSIHKGLNFNLQCQTAIWVDGSLSGVRKVFKISSGRIGHETQPGNFKVGWVVNGWYESHTYPDGWMYRPMFFDQGRAFHGSKSDDMVKPYPASHGCVRMLHADVDFLWSQKLKVGSAVHVYGTWKG